MMRWLLVFGLLAGCASGLDVNNAASFQARKAAPNQLGSEVSVLRGYANVGGKRSEVAGVRCSAENALLRVASISTPSRVTLPTYLQADRFAERGKPPPLRLTCTFNGERRTVMVEPQSAVGNETVRGTMVTDPNTGTVSQPTNTRLTGRLSSTLPWRYSLPAVTF